MEDKEIWWRTAPILQHRREMDEKLHPPLPRERWPRNCQELPRHNPYFHSYIEPEIEKILRKNQNGFQRKRSTTSQILTIHRIIEVRAKNLLFVDFSKTFDSTLRGRMEQILRACGLLEESVSAIMMFYKNVNVHSPDGDTDFVDIVAGIH